jgi:hypothetical protein
MTHLGVFPASASIFCHAFDEVSPPFLIDLHVLLFHLASNGERWFNQFHLILLQGLHPVFYRSQHLQDLIQRFFSLPKLIPILVEHRLQARPTDHFCSSLLRHFG